MISSAVMRALILAALLALPLPAASVAAEDPFTGRWKLDETKVRNQPETPRTQFLSIEVAGARITITHQGVDAKGAPVEWAIHADLEGKLFGVIDSPDTDFVRCWRSDPHTLLLKIIRNSSTARWETAELSKNGKSLKVTQTTLDAKGKETKSVLWFDKQ